MRKFILYSISFFFISMMLLLSCSENANDVLTTPKVSSITTYVDENVSLDYAELGKLPDVYTKGMDKEEKEAWEKLSTKYRIKKNALSSKFYQASQAQRQMETTMRAQRANIKNLKQGNADSDTVIAAQARYLNTLSQYKDFSKKMKLPEQMERVYMDGLGRMAGGRNIRTSIKKQEEKIAYNTLKNAVGRDIILVERTDLKGTPNSITQKVGKKGGIERNYYDDSGKQIKQISNNNHGNAKMHPYGEKGEHAHDYIYDSDNKLIGRPTRELTQEERKENADIL